MTRISEERLALIDRKGLNLNVITELLSALREAYAEIDSHIYQKKYWADRCLKAEEAFKKSLQPKIDYDFSVGSSIFGGHE